MILLPALYIWLGVVATGLLATLIAGYLVDYEKAKIAGFSIALGMTTGASSSVAQSQVEWWVQLLGIIAGLGTLWWHLFRKKEFGRG